MARVTVEDCLKNVKNRFELVILSAKRARQLMHGKEPKVAWDNDKPTVVALREIAAGFTDFDTPTHEDIIELRIATPVATIIAEEVEVEIEIDDFEDADEKTEPKTSEAAPEAPEQSDAASRSDQE